MAATFRFLFPKLWYSSLSSVLVDVTVVTDNSHALYDIAFAVVSKVLQYDYDHDYDQGMTMTN